MSRSMQTLTLGVALGAAAFAGATFIGTADAHRHATAADSDIAFIDAFGLIDRIVQPEALLEAAQALCSDAAAATGAHVSGIKAMIPRA